MATDHIGYIFILIKNAVISSGYWGIGIGMLLESACMPVPSELILPLAGFMIAQGRTNMIYSNIAVAIGSMSGSFISYLIGYYGGRPFILRYGKYFFMSEDHFLKAERTFNKFGSTAVFFGRLLPVVRTFISLPAGISRMEIKRFLIFSLAGMLPWNFVLIFLGYKFGRNYNNIVSPLFHKFEYIVLGILLAASLFLIIKQLLKSNRQIR